MTPDPRPSAAPPPPSPEVIFNTLRGFQHTAALKTAIALDLFTLVGEGLDTPAALAQRTQCAERGVRILCDSLAVLGMLAKFESRFQLTPDSAAFLSRHSPAYLGSIADFLTSPAQMEGFARLTEAVRIGGTAAPEDPGLAHDSPHWVNFARNMAPLMRFPAQALAELLLPKLTQPCKVLDIAAGHGLFGLAMAQRNPHAQIYALDWPSVLEVAQQNAIAAGVADRWHALPGNAFETDLGSDYDWVLLPNFLHHFDPATCEGLLRRVHASLAPEGEVAAPEFVVDDDRLTPPTSALFALIMLANTPHGDAYSFADLDQMFRNAGFSDTELHPLPPTMQRVVIATP